MKPELIKNKTSPSRLGGVKEFSMEIPTVTTTRLVYQHKVIVDMIDGLNDGLIRRQPHPGKWSIFEQIVHLQTFQHVFDGRIRAIRETDNPRFTPYSAEADPAFLDNCRLSTREIMQDLLSKRKDMAARYPQIPREELVRIGVHGIYGAMNIPEWLNYFLLHEAHHLYAIFRDSATLKGELRK